MTMRPVGDRILVRRIEEPKTTPSGIHVPDVAELSSKAWRGRVEDFESEDPTITIPWLRVGRVVLFKPYVGIEVDDGGLIIEIADVLAVEFK